MSKTPIIGHGLAVGLDRLEGLLFDPAKPYRFCRICGDIYQTEADRVDNPVVLDVQTRQTLWSSSHARTHTENEHLSLRLSGRYMTPDAAIKLAAFGIVSIVDLALDNEVQAAYGESKSIPKDDCEG